jgi:site-specific DNA-methyltransferase (cytosine-N4-specific)
MNRSKILSPSKLEIIDSTILEGDVTEVLPRLPNAFFQCVVTSPPYWGLRDYGISGQIGLEETLGAYIHKITNVFSEVRRVLKDDGVMWLNIGDGYTSGNRGWRATDKKNPNRAMSVRPDNPPGLKDKDLLGVPWRIAFALQADGWYLRSDIIWNKPNAMPESVKDRPTRSHEYVFMFTKNERYLYQYDAALEQTDEGSWRNRRTVWNINTAPGHGTHIAGFPDELVQPCILSSTKTGDFVLDPFFGCGTVGSVCRRLSRQVVGIELNPTYVAEACQLLNGSSAKSSRSSSRCYQQLENDHQAVLLEGTSKTRRAA